MKTPVKTVWTFSGNEDLKHTGDGPSLNEARSNHACSIFNSEAHDDRPVIVVAGGKAHRTFF